MKLIVISPPTSLKHETQQASGMIQAGLRHYHLRKPEDSSHEFEQYVQRLSSLERQNIIVHSRHELVAEWNLKVSMHVQISDPSASSQ